MPTSDKQVFVTAVEKQHGQNLRRYLASRLRNAAADFPDLVQEVFLRLLRVDQHETIRNPQAYLITIASHVLHQHALRQAANPEPMEMLDALFEMQSTAEDPALQIEDRCSIRRICEATSAWYGAWTR